MDTVTSAVLPDTDVHVSFTDPLPGTVPAVKDTVTSAVLPDTHVSFTDPLPGTVPAVKDTVTSTVLPDTDVSFTNPPPGTVPAVMNTATSAHLHDKAKFPVDSFVEIVFTEKGRRQKNKHYYGKIIKVEDDDVLVHFLVPKQITKNLFVWAEEAWVSSHQIAGTVSPPKLAPVRGLAFIFSH